MNRKYCIGSLYNKIDLLEAFIKRCDENDEIYLLGNFSINASQQTSQVTYVYLYNLHKQKLKNNSLPTIKLLKGKNEDKFNFDKKFLTQLAIDTTYKYIKNMELSSLFDQSIPIPSVDELYDFINNQPWLYETEDYILVSGYYNPLLSTQIQIEQIYNESNKGLIYGSPGLITKTYYDYVKTNKLRLWTKKSIEQFNKTDLNYMNFKSIEEYNNLLKNTLNKVIICGNFYDPLFKKNLEPINYSHLWMIDGGLNRSFNNEDEWFYFKPQEEKFNVIDITNIKKIELLK